MTFSNIIRAIRSHLWLALAIPAVAIAVATAISLSMADRYTATAAVLIDLKSNDPFSSGYTGIVPPGYMATQVDVMRSERVTKNVIRKLKLDEQPQLIENFRKTNDGGDMTPWLVALLQKDLYVKPSRESNIIELSYTGATPEFSAAMANAYMQAYIDTTVELKTEPAKQYSAMFEEQSKKAREGLEAAQARLSAYQREKGIIATDERLDIENARLQELSSQLVAMQALADQSSSRKAQADTNPANLDEVLSNPVVAGLKTEMSRQEARLQELAARYGSDHPAIAETKANIDSLRARIATEVRVITGSVNLNSNVNKSRESQVRAALDQQRAKVLQIKLQRDQVSALEADVNNAQRAYDAIAARFTQTSLESRASQSNVSPLQYAARPTKPSSPRTLLNILGAAVIGGLMGILGAVLFERLDQRLRDETDLMASFEGFFVGEVSEVDMTKQAQALPLMLSDTKRKTLALPAT